MDEKVGDLVRSVAVDFIRMRGKAAFGYLNDQAEIALEVTGDIESAIVWWQLAVTTVELLYSSDQL